MLLKFMKRIRISSWEFKSKMQKFPFNKSLFAGVNVIVIVASINGDKIYISFMPFKKYMFGFMFLTAAYVTEFI